MTRLTALNVEKAKPLKNDRGQIVRVEYPDAGCAGLYLVVQPSGAKSWAFRYRLNGKPKKLTIGRAIVVADPKEEPTAPALGQPNTLAGARRLATEAAQRLVTGTDPAREKR